MSFEFGIIGGGINGVGLAREFALRGHSVILFEKGDIGHGTSSASSKLIHGGLRYLENGDFILVKEALRERFLLLQNAPHLVTPLPFLIPVYEHSPFSLWKLRLGAWVYQFLAGKKQIKKNQFLSAKSVLKKYPNLKPGGLKGGIIYWDAQMDDARLCLETALQAQELGATISTYSEVTDIQLNGNDMTITVVQQTSPPTPLPVGKERGEVAQINVECVINAAGPWANEVLEKCGHVATQPIRPSKGSHIVVSQSLSDTALLIFSPIDSRVVFVIPYLGHTLIGTTDQDYSGSLDQVRISPDETTYLLDTARTYFPNTPLQKTDIIGTFSGIRPLANAIGSSPYHVSREHKLIQHSDQFFSLVGGKYTTFRSICEDVAKQILKQRKIPFDPTLSTESLVLKENVCNEKLSAILRENPNHAQHLQGTTHTHADVIYAIRHEWAKRVEDFFRRRTHLALLPGNGRQCLDDVIAIFASELRWDEATKQKEKADYLSMVEGMFGD